MKDQLNCHFFNDELTAADACRGVRQYAVPSVGVADDRVAQHADVYFYVDKELLVNELEQLGFVFH